MSRQRVLPGAQGQSQQQLFSANNGAHTDIQVAPGAPDYPPGAGPSMRRPSNAAVPPRRPPTGNNGYPHNVAATGRASMDDAAHAGPSPPRQRSVRERDGQPSRPTTSRRVREVFDTDEETILKTYGLSTLQPDVWEDTNAGIDGSTAAAMLSPGLPGARNLGPKHLAGQDESDPLGLYRGSVLSNVGEIPPDVFPQILLQNKTFDAQAFLNTVHPGAAPEDLRRGRENLKQSIESRSGALQRLVEENFDRFISIKAATAGAYSEMQLGPLSQSGDYSVAELKEALRLAQGKADTVWNPILEARLKADRLRSTLGIFERSKFFFTLPGVLSESIAAGRYDAALVAYKKGKYLLDSRPGALLGLPPGTIMTEAQSEKHRKVFEKVWGQIEKTMADLKATLMDRLRDPRRNLEDVEKTIEILLELDPTLDPVWIYLDIQHHHIMQVLRNSSMHSIAKFKGVLKRQVSSSAEETARALDLRVCVLSLESPSSDKTLEKAAGFEAWKVLLEIVHSLSDIMLQTLPNFWKVGKGYMDGKYQAKDTKKGIGSSAQQAKQRAAVNKEGSRRSPSQVKTMTNDIINLYITLLSEFFHLSSETKASADANSLPEFVAPNSNALCTGWYLLKVLAELADCTNEIGGLANLGNDSMNNLKEFMNSIRWNFTEAVCLVWVKDAKIFYRLEEWALDTDDLSKTVYLKRMATYQRHVARLAYRASGGNEERASHLFVSSTTPGNAIALLRRTANDEPLSADFTKRIHTAYLDAVYAFLDGLVHVAFSEPMPLLEDPDQAAPAAATVMRNRSQSQQEAGSSKSENIDVHNRDVRILLTVSNLSHFKNDWIGKIADQLSTALKLDMTQDSKTLHDVVGQLDKILFDDYIKGRSVQLEQTIHRGVIGDGVDWYSAPKPTEVHPYIYDVLLSLVLVHAQVTAIARSLVTRTVGALVEEIAKHALTCFSQVRTYGMGGMLQATLEMEFLHQTLNVHVSLTADATLQEIYKIISQAYAPPPNGDGSSELQRELEQLKMTLTQARRATALQFLCFREKRPQAVACNASNSGNHTPAVPSGTRTR